MKIATGSPLMVRAVFVTVFLAMLASCASTADGEMSAVVWAFPEFADGSGYIHPILLKSPRNGPPREIDPMSATHLAAAKRRVAAASGLRFDLAIYDSVHLNAFVTEGAARPLIVISLSLLQVFGHDEGALSGVLFHEAAHVSLGHESAVRRRREEDEMRGSAPLAGALAAARIPAAGTIAAATAMSRMRAYTRDEEQAADRLALAWLIDSGIGTCGFSRVLQRVLEEAPGHAAGYSTHPATAERMAMFRNASSKPCGDG